MFDIDNKAAPPRPPARKKSKNSLPPGCDVCKGRPWVSDATGRGAHRCILCGRGAALTAKDRERANANP